jgi:hypothetical protein
VQELRIVMTWLAANEPPVLDLSRALTQSALAGAVQRAGLRVLAHV